jgi:hypothetical protein
MSNSGDNGRARTPLRAGAAPVHQRRARSDAPYQRRFMERMGSRIRKFEDEDDDENEDEVYGG